MPNGRPWAANLRYEGSAIHFGIHSGAWVSFLVPWARVGFSVSPGVIILVFVAVGIAFFNLIEHHAQ